MLFAGIGLAGLMLVTPAMAWCGGTDKNGCSVSPVTYKSCSADLKSDLKDLRCDIIDVIRDIFHNGNSGDILNDIKDIQADLKEIKFDYATLATLKKPGHHYGWNNGHFFWW